MSTNLYSNTTIPIVQATNTTSNGYYLQQTNTGPVWTSNNTSGYGMIGTISDNVSTGVNTPTITVTGDAEFKGNVTVKGVSLSELLQNIEQRLAILHPNEKLEEKWEKLKELGNQYRELENEILHSEEMWKILKK